MKIEKSISSISSKNMEQALNLYRIGQYISHNEIENVMMRGRGGITSLKGLNFWGKIKKYFVEKRLRKNKLRSSDIRFLLDHLGTEPAGAQNSLGTFCAFVRDKDLKKSFNRILDFVIPGKGDRAYIELKNNNNSERLYYIKKGLKYQLSEEEKARAEGKANNTISQKDEASVINKQNQQTLSKKGREELRKRLEEDESLISNFNYDRIADETRQNLTPPNSTNE